MARTAQIEAGYETVPSPQWVKDKSEVLACDPIHVCCVQLDGTGVQSSPRALAVDTAWARVCTASLMKMPFTCDLTVSGDICSA